VVGGDGTLADLVPGVLARADAPPLALIPAGTGNDVAKTLGVHRAGPEAALGLALGDGGEEIRLDAGRIDGRAFLNGFGVGIDGAVAESAERVPLRLGIATYLIGLAAVLPSWKPFGYRIEIDDEVTTGEATLIAVAHGQVCGGGFRLTPRADPTDGKLDVCLIGPFGRLRLLAKLPLALSGRHLDEPETTYCQARKVRLELERELVAHIDGNLLHGLRDITIETIPAAVRAIRRAGA